MLAVGGHAVVPLHERNQVAEQIFFEIGALFVAGDAGGGRVRVGGRRDDDHRRRFFVGDEVVENQVHAAEVRPHRFIAVGAVQQIQHWQLRR